MPLTSETQKTIALVVRHNTVGIEEPRGLPAGRRLSRGVRGRNRGPPGHGGDRVDERGRIGEVASAAIVMGGDGTMLGIARQLAPYDVPLIGINQGRLGFMTDIPIERMIPVLGES
jgi:NAD+ kinase